MRLFRRHQRYPLARELSVELRLWPTEEDRQHLGELRAIGPSGMQFISEAPMRAGDELEFILAGANISQVDAIARITGVSPWPGEKFLVEGEFLTELPADLISKLIDRKQVEDREHPRFAISATGTITYPSSPTAHKVEVIDVSRGGFRVKIDTPGPVGATFSLRMDDSARSNSPIKAEITWQAPSPEGAMLGCRFTDSDGIFLLQDHVKTPLDQPTPMSRPYRQSLWVALAGTILFFTLASWLYTRR